MRNNNNMPTLGRKLHATTNFASNSLQVKKKTKGNRRVTSTYDCNFWKLTTPSHSVAALILLPFGENQNGVWVLEAFSHLCTNLSLWTFAKIVPLSKLDAETVPRYSSPSFSHQQFLTARNRRQSGKSPRLQSLSGCWQTCWAEKGYLVLLPQGNIFSFSKY